MAHTAQTFQDLVVWQRAHRLVLDIYQCSQSFPTEEKYGITAQLRRAAVSVPANIAEGFTRSSKPDKLRFYNIAQGSLEETRYFLIVVRDLGYCTTDHILEQVTEVARLLQVYTQAIRSSQHNL